MSDARAAPKRGRENGRRRSVVSISMAADTLLLVDRLAAELRTWDGRPLNRSQLVRKAVNVLAAAWRGEGIGNLRNY